MLRNQTVIDKERLKKDIDREDRRKRRNRIEELRKKLREAYAARKVILKEAVEKCRSVRIALRERIRAMRIRAAQELRDSIARERADAKARCHQCKLEARKTSKDKIEKRRRELAAERQLLLDLRRIDLSQKRRRQEHPHASYLERRSESDEEVRRNLPTDLLALWERVKRGIKASGRLSRTEAFLKYAEENPDEVIAAMEHDIHRYIKELERQHAEERRPSRAPRRTSRAAFDEAVPF